MLNANEIVKYANPQDGESELRFVVLHIEQGKADIQLIGDETIKPIECVSVDEICPA